MAEGVRAGRGVPRGLPAVVHAHPSEVRHAADGVGGLRAPLGVDGRVRQPRRAGHGRPGPSPATWAQARRPPRRTPVSSTCRPGAGGRASVSRASSGASVTARCCTQRPAREGRAAELGEPLAHPGHPGVGHDRLLHQIHRQRPQAWPILRPTRRRCWERAYAHRLAAGAAPAARSPPGAPAAGPAPVAARAAPPAGVWHCAQTAGRGSTTASGGATRCTVSPRWPSCPPAFWPLRRRRCFVVRARPSLDGGLLLVWRSLARRASNSCTRAANTARCSRAGSYPSRRRAFSAFSAAFSSSSVMRPCYAYTASPPTPSRPREQLKRLRPLTASCHGQEVHRTGPQDCQRVL